MFFRYSFAGHLLFLAIVGVFSSLDFSLPTTSRSHAPTTHASFSTSRFCFACQKLNALLTDRALSWRFIPLTLSHPPLCMPPTIRRVKRRKEEGEQLIENPLHNFLAQGETTKPSASTRSRAQQNKAPAAPASAEPAAASVSVSASGRPERPGYAKHLLMPEGGLELSPEELRAQDPKYAYRPNAAPKVRETTRFAQLLSPAFLHSRAVELTRTVIITSSC